jgi:hypothetical protein
VLETFENNVLSKIFGPERDEVFSVAECLLHFKEDLRFM